MTGISGRGGIIGVLSVLVLWAARRITSRWDVVIRRQRLEIDARVRELTELLETNCELRRRVERASSGSANDHERLLRRIGADLHDGIGQMLAFALLRLGDLSAPGADPQAGRMIREALEAAMTEIRSMVAGLTLPRIENMGLGDAVDMVIARHEHLTMTRVERRLAPDLPAVDPSVRLAVCRFVQEGLSNAFKHARAQGQSVRVRASAGNVVATVSDRGTDGVVDPSADEADHCGLVGLRNRLESLGGRLEIDSRMGAGTTITGTLPAR